MVFFSFDTERGGRAKINYFSLELGWFGECRELQVPGLCQQQSNEVTSRLTLGSPSSPSTSWMFILCSHLDLLLCGISSHFGVCSRQFQGQIREYWGDTGDPYTPAHTRNQELMFWIPQVHSFVPIIRKPPSPEPQKKFTGIKGIITLQNEPQLH